MHENTISTMIILRFRIFDLQGDSNAAVVPSTSLVDNSRKSGDAIKDKKVHDGLF